MKKGTEFSQCLIGVCLFNAVRVFLLEIVGVFASVFDGEGGFPAKLIPRFVDVCEVLVDVARTARHDLVWDLDAVSLFEGVDKFKDRGALASSEVIDDKAWVAL